jgi:hypothetical protein
MRDKARYDGHNRRPQQTPMKVIIKRRRRRKLADALRNIARTVKR